MRHRLLALTLTALVITGTRPATGEDLDPDTSPAACLELVAVLNSPHVIQPGQPIETALTLRNTADDDPQLVVRPGDGSDDGRREPHVWFQVERQVGDDAWVEAPLRRLYRCKVFEPDWRDDVVSLAPGETLDVRSWAAGPGRYDLQEAGSYQLRAHYAWRREPVAGTSDGDLGRMADVPAFTVTSAAVPFTVIRPLDVRTEVLGSVPATGAPIGAVIDIHGVNTTDAPLDWSPREWEPQVTVEGGSLRKNDSAMPAAHDNPHTLPPGGSWVAFGTWSALNDLVPEPEAAVVRVTITLRSLVPGGPRIRAQTVDLPVAR